MNKSHTTTLTSPTPHPVGGQHGGTGRRHCNHCRRCTRRCSLAQGAGDDAEPIRLFGQARAGQQMLDDTESRLELDDQEVFRLNDQALNQFWDAADKIVITRPSTAAGMQAKASMIPMILQQTAASGIW